MTALLSAIIRSTKMKGTWKIADSTSRAYKRGLIISSGDFKKPPVKKSKKEQGDDQKK